MLVIWNSYVTVTVPICLLCRYVTTALFLYDSLFAIDLPKCVFVGYVKTSSVMVTNNAYYDVDWH